MSFCEYVARTALEVLFEMLSLFDSLERHIQFDLPRLELGGVRTLSGIMIREPLPKVSRMTYVKLLRMTEALNHIRIEHGLPSIAWNPIREKSSFAKPMGRCVRFVACHP